MTGKQIAENLRKNAEKWVRYRYLTPEGGMCVIGLKLREFGVSDEKLMEWGMRGISSVIFGADSPPLSTEETLSLTALQEANDNSLDIVSVINYAEANAEVDFPLEKLAEALKAQS